MYGMKLSDLYKEKLKEILLLYERIAGGRVRQYALSSSSQPISARLEYIQEAFEHYNAVGWRFGSNLDGGEENAKLFIWNERSIFHEVTRSRIDRLIRFSFDPNLISGNEAKEMKKDFEEAVNKLLIEWKVNIEL